MENTAESNNDDKATTEVETIETSNSKQSSNQTTSEAGSLEVTGAEKLSQSLERHPNDPICIQCLRMWKPYVKAKESIPDCIFSGGHILRTKCERCSQRRIECHKVNNKSLK
jgi:hypothetical protein